jgi:hypothetical protein
MTIHTLVSSLIMYCLTSVKTVVASNISIMSKPREQLLLIMLYILSLKDVYILSHKMFDDLFFINKNKNTPRGFTS